MSSNQRVGTVISPNPVHTVCCDRSEVALHACHLVGWVRQDNIGPSFTPTQGSLHNRVKGRKSRRPPQNASGVSPVGDQNWRVSQAAYTLTNQNSTSAHPFHCGNDLAHRGAPARAQIESNARPARGQVLEGQYVRLGQIRDVDVVADRGTIRCWIVGSP